MLEESKSMFVECADLIDGWRKMSKSELVNKYLDSVGTPLAESYYAAIVCKYWYLINSYYSRQAIKIATEQDCYDWIVDGINKALTLQPWLTEGNLLFGDEKGPEKAIVVCIMSIRANFYQYTKYAKRKLNYNNLSLDQLEEESSDGYYLIYNDTYETIYDYITEYIKKYFNLKDYFACFFIDAIFNYDILVDNSDFSCYNISMKKFGHYISSVDEEYFNKFSLEYDIPVDSVKKAFEYIKNMPYYRIHSNISDNLNRLKKDTSLFTLLVM